MVGLFPMPAPGSQFVSWGGDCGGSGGCTVTMDGPHHVIATFRPAVVPPDEIGPPSNPINDPGKAGGVSTLTLVYDCYSPEELWLDEVFVDLLHREIDQGSRDAFFPRFQAGLSLTQAALDVLHSVEYRTLLIQGFYNTFLHRAATPTELASFMAMLAGGATDEDVMAAILSSEEYYATRGGGTNSGFITALYQDLLGRSPSSAEQAQWDAAFGAGATRQQVALQVLKSTEFRTRLLKGWFQAYLGRQPTDVELNFYLSHFAAGETDEMIQAEILGSTEFVGRVEDYSATIDWGDGTTTKGTVKHTTNGGRDCEVTGQHTFPNAGDIPVVVTVMDPDGHTDAFRGLMHIQLQLPPPGRENVQPFGTVLINVNGRFVPLTKFTQVRVGTELDTTNGRVRLTSPDGSNGLFYEGRFKILRVFQTVKGKKVAITLLLLDRTAPGLQAAHDFGIHGGAAAAGQEGRPPPLGEREGQVPHARQVRLGDGHGNGLGNARLLRRDAGVRPERPRRRARHPAKHAPLRHRRAQLLRARAVSFHSMREREPEPRHRPEHGEQQRARVGDAEVLVLLAGDPGEVPAGRGHRAEELTLRRAPDGVLVGPRGRVAGDDAEEEQRTEPRPVAREERARDLDDGHDREHRRDHARNRGEPAPGGRNVTRVEELANVLEQVEDPDTEDQDDAAGFRVGELNGLREVVRRAIEEVDLRRQLLGVHRLRAAGRELLGERVRVRNLESLHGHGGKIVTEPPDGTG